MAMEDDKPTTLLVRHLPSDFTDQEKIDLLCHFGAEHVRPMGIRGSMKHTAFAQFSSAEVANMCIKRLHQVKILGCRLTVEYAKEDQKKHFSTGIAETGKPSKPLSGANKEDKPDDNAVLKKPRDVTKQTDPVFDKHNIPFPRKPSLFYQYPPPTVSTLTNIATALGSHSRFYNQVLHLMNKMNLPCPFGPVTAAPPVALDVPTAPNRAAKRQAADLAETGGEIEEVEMEYSSTEESELETDDEAKSVEKKREKENPSRKKLMKKPRKRMKLVQPDLSTMIKPLIPAQPSEVFENVDSRKSTQINFKLSGRESSSDLPHAQYQKEIHIDEKKETEPVVTVVEGGFGKVEPATKPQVTPELEQRTDLTFKIDPEKFLSLESIETGRLRKEQMKEFSVFKKYSPGEPTSRLYIKNLTKHTTEHELVNLFGRFVDWSLEMSHIAFDIRLMKEGKMKGQAFVTLPDEDSAHNIVTNCNGFILNGKPIVIQFARSAKAKETDNKN